MTIKTGITPIQSQSHDPIQLADFLPYQITLLADLIARRTAAIARQYDGLSLTQWRVMAAIAEQPGRTANEVVAVTPTDKGIVSRAVKSLLDIGFLTRKASLEDGRLGHLFLTAKGQRRYVKIAAQVRDLEHEMISVLSDRERKTLGPVLKKLAARLAR